MYVLCYCTLEQNPGTKISNSSNHAAEGMVEFIGKIEYMYDTSFEILKNNIF
jgi:hypothetical protein